MITSLSDEGLGNECKRKSVESMDSTEFFESSFSSSNYDSGVDGLRSHIVALDLNVDNHISQKACCPKYNYNLSGAMSMTPNPRNEYGSPQHISANDRLWQMKKQSSYLKSKLTFENDMHAPAASFDIPYSQGFSSHNDSKQINYDQYYEVNRGQQVNDLHSFQQIILPNGVPALVVPMYARPPPQAQPKGPYNNFTARSKYRKATSKKCTTAISLDTPLASFKGKMLEMSQDQIGCRYFQEKICKEGSFALNIIKTELEGNYQWLMMDTFGNYLFQKIIECVSVTERTKILQIVQPVIVDASINLHGTRCVQKFVELCGGSKEQTDILISCFKDHITKLSMDTNGNHIVQRCLQYFSLENKQFIFNTVLKDMLLITKHRHGCCVFQRCLDAADSEMRKLLINNLVEYAGILVVDPFANYVIQYVLDNSQNDEADKIVSKFLGNIPKLSMQKFSSNVIEKCLLQGSRDVKEKIIEELRTCGHLKKLLHDQYGNYVVQRALSTSDLLSGLELVRVIIPLLHEVSKFNPSCARRVADKALKKYPNLAIDSRLSQFAVSPRIVTSR